MTSSPIASPVPSDVTPTVSRPTHLDIALMGEASTSFRDQAGTGARLAATWWLSSFIGIRASGGYRASSVNAAAARVTHFDGGAGIAARLYGSTDGFRVAVYGDVRLARELVTRTREDGADEHRAHTLPYVALTGEAGLSLAHHLAGIFTLGTEVALGRTTLTVKESIVSSLPAATLNIGLGLRWSF